MATVDAGAATPTAPDSTDPAQAITLPEWLAEKGVTNAAALGSDTFGTACRRFRIGSPPEDAVRCPAVVHRQAKRKKTDVYRVEMHDRVIVVRGKQPVTVLDVAAMVAPLDKEVWTQPNIVDLVLEISADGTHATLRDLTALPRSALSGPPRPCSKALPLLRANAKKPAIPEVAGWAQFDLELAERVCAGRGTYVWKSGRFQRAGKTPPE